jgi:hypothetical protein
MDLVDDHLEIKGVTGLGVGISWVVGAKDAVSHINACATVHRKLRMTGIALFVADDIAWIAD